MSIPEQVARLVEEAILPLGVEHFGFCPLEALSGLLDCRGKRLQIGRAHV